MQEEMSEDIVRDNLILDIQKQFKKKMSRAVCENATIEMQYNSLEFSVGGCGGQKRNGSKYCQDCSDNYRKEYGR